MSFSYYFLENQLGFLHVWTAHSVVILIIIWLERHNFVSKGLNVLSTNRKTNFVLFCV